MLRRELLKNAAGTVVAMMPTESRGNAIEDPCEYHVKCLAAALQERHGGHWRISLDKNCEFVLISKAL